MTGICQSGHNRGATPIIYTKESNSRNTPITTQRGPPEKQCRLTMRRAYRAPRRLPWKYSLEVFPLPRIESKRREHDECLSLLYESHTSAYMSCRFCAVLFFVKAQFACRRRRIDAAALVIRGGKSEEDGRPRDALSSGWRSRVCSLMIRWAST